jgi:hypothetical protein
MSTKSQTPEVSEHSHSLIDVEEIKLKTHDKQITQILEIEWILFRFTLIQNKKKYNKQTKVYIV